MIRRIKFGLSAAARAENSLQVRNTVEEILGDIAARGGAAVRDFSQKFDQWSPARFRLTADEIADCVRSMPLSTIEDIKFAQTQIRNFALAQRECLTELEIETLPGVVLGHRNVPVNSVGCYIPGGRYPMVASAQDRKSTRLNSSHVVTSRMPSSA